MAEDSPRNVYAGERAWIHVAGSPIGGFSRKAAHGRKLALLKAVYVISKCLTPVSPAKVNGKTFEEAFDLKKIETVLNSTG